MSKNKIIEVADLTKLGLIFSNTNGDVNVSTKLLPDDIADRCIVKQTGPNDEQPYRMVAHFDRLSEFTSCTIYEDEGGSVSLYYLPDTIEMDIADLVDQLNVQDGQIGDALIEWGYMSYEEKGEFESKQEYLRKSFEDEDSFIRLANSKLIYDLVAKKLV